jgi:hypothetical protein
VKLLKSIGMLMLMTLPIACADSKPKGDLPPLHPTTGSVSRGGSPLTAGQVQLKAEPAKPEFNDLLINAEVGKDGTFTLQTIHALSMKKAPGVPAGTYKATFVPSLGDQQGNIIPVELPKPVTIVAGTNELKLEVPSKK